MHHTPAIEDIRTMRRERGIFDLELDRDIRSLAKGDLVRLTLLADASDPAGETVLVRITSRRDDVFRGKLVQAPRQHALRDLNIGSALVFRSAHVHSLMKRLEAASEPALES